MHPLQELLLNRKNSDVKGIVSICTANPLVLRACFKYFKNKKSPLLVEATANQVNQFGGYTGMFPVDFYNFVHKLADEEDFPKNKLFLGGDHLGPLVWASENEEEAMSKAKDLVNDYVEAGFTKIHLDTSMKLASDRKDEKLETEVIAKRGIELMEVCEIAYQKRLKLNDQSIKPIYILGSEVPIPGGAQEEEGIEVTSTKDFEDTVSIYHQNMIQHHLEEEWKRVVAFVVQPGVEFGDDSIHNYQREEAKNLILSKEKYQNIVFEGHSTDYQTPIHLREMVEDNISILKVGPALTFALREALFSLSYMEDILVDRNNRSNFRTILEQAMLDEPKNWKKHYHGSENELKFKRQFSFSDRSRYYMPDLKVNESIQKLCENTNDLPLSLLSQFVPYQYRKIKAKKINNTALDIIYDYIALTLDEYLYAIETN